ncbi:MAG: prepilin-type N-terminal cleavage/methylation domain-containing protein [Proteobacteria bacterium]|nr:prepilin-type N-terminal cleavage/methylation domain-containing protein [Pseudomonadota bacterium]
MTLCPAPSRQRGLTLIELMIAMLLGLIVVGGVLGIFVANSETHRRTDDLARIQENARVSVQLIGHSMQEAGGNPCGIPPGPLINNTTGNNWWAGGNNFDSSFRGYAGGNGFPANGGVNMVNGSDALITVSGNTLVKTVIADNPPAAAMIVNSTVGLNMGDILFACSMDNGRGVVFQAGAINNDALAVNRVPFPAPFDVRMTTLGRVNAEGWFVGNNGRNGTSLFRAFIGDGGQIATEEIAPDVAAMQITYLLLNANNYVAANNINDNEWINVIAAHIELIITRNAGNGAIIQRTVGLTVNLRNRLN